MIKVEVKSVNASHVRIVCDRGVLQEIVEYFSFFAPAYQFHPKFKARIWDGKIRLVSPRDSLIYVGLIDKLREFCEDSEYEFVDNSGYSNSKEDVPENIAEIIAKDVNLDPKYKVRDYQAQYIYNAIRDSRSINLSPTSSGKSLIIYLIMSYYRMKYQSRTLIVVPTVGLVKQMANDFLDYGCDPSIIHGISAGASKKTSHPIVVSTWQSLARIKEKSWFEQFDVILGDEVHTFAAKSLQDIMNSLTECYWRHGFTGTIGEDSKVNKMVLEGLFGTVRKFVSTKDLINSGTVANFDVTAIVMKHGDQIKKEFHQNLAKLQGGAKKYSAEREFLTNHDVRNKFIRKIVKNNRDNNGLILFDLVEKHGKVLKKYLETIPGTKLHFIYGGTPADERERVRQLVENDNLEVVTLDFEEFKLNIPVDTFVDLSDGTTKKAMDLKPSDDISDAWLQENWREFEDFDHYEVSK